MGSKIFKSILDEKIQKFIYSYKKVSNDIFLDEDGKLIHPGEFGMYREEVAKELIRSFIPQRLDIGDGFIITSTGNVSTQCDLIIYDKYNCPLIENNSKQRFFPIECVVAVGEIKSDLTETKLKETLIKLKENKKLRNDIFATNSFVYKDDGFRKTQCFNPRENVKDEIITFVICNNLKFKNNEKIVNEMDEIYEEIPYYLRHNMILSIEDGVFIYKNETNQKIQHCYPCDNDGVKKKNSLLKPSILGYEHIMCFLNSLYLGTSITSIMYPEMANYIGNVKINETIDENN